MNDFVLVTERWHWPPNQIFDLDFLDFTMFADAVRELNRLDAEAMKPKR